MSNIDTSAIRDILAEAHAEGRNSLYEHECYRLLAATGAEAAPASRLIPIGERPTAADLEHLIGDKVVLKVVSPDITHKTEARGVRIVAREIGAVEAAFDLMLREVPEIYGAYLEKHEGEILAALAGRRGRGLEQRLADRIVGILLCSYMPPDSQGFATELFVGIRHTDEFGPIISAGLGGVEMEILARQTKKGAAVAISPTATIDGPRFFELFRKTLSYERLTGAMRGSRRLVDDAILVEGFQAFIDLANHFSETNPKAQFHLEEVEVNPFAISGSRMAPLDGVCRFRTATTAPQPRPINKIGSLLKPRSIGVMGVSESARNPGRIILGNIVDAGFDRAAVRVIHPTAEEIDGVACVRSISDLQDTLDLFVVAVGANQVATVIDDLIARDAANAVILIPGGIGEKKGSQELEQQVKKRIRAAAHLSDGGGPVFLGGNSLGVISHPGRYDTLFIPDSKLPKSRGAQRRKLCFLSQSGAFIISNLSRMPWLDPAYAISMGNQIDLTAGDLLSYIKDDPEIEVFAIYMEGFQPGDGRAFVAAVEETVALGKDVIFYKAGRTTEGRSATAGHTASVAGDYAVCENALAQAGAFVATDFNEFSDLLRVALGLRGKTVSGNRLAAISNAGYESVGMADSIRQRGAELVLPVFSAATSEALAKILADNRLDGLVDVKNPLDITPMANDTVFADVVAELVGDGSIDAVVAGVVPLTPAMQTLSPGEGHTESILEPGSIAQMLPQIVRSTDTPVVAVVDAGTLFDPMANALQEKGLPVFRSADRAVRALCRWVDVKSRMKIIVE